MPPLDSTNPNSLDRIMPVDHGSSIAREVQSQVVASLGRDSALGMAGTEALGLPGAGAEQTVSPLINMITKMPGHIGFFSSLFDALGAFFAPQLEALSNLGMNLGLDPSMMGHMSLGMPEHVGLDLSLLPADAPIFGMNGLKDAAHGLNGDLLSNKLNASLGQGLNLHRDAAGLQGSLQESLQISAPGNLLNKPVFEGGHLSGPSLAQTQPAPQLAGNNRLFSDSIGSSGHNLSGQSMSAAANTPAGNNINVNGSTFGNSSDPVDLTVGGRDEQLLAMGGDSYQSTVGSMKPESAAASASAENLGGMKAKALSLDSQAPADMKHGIQDMKGDIKGDLKHDLKHDVKAEAKHDIKEAKAEPRTHKTFDRSSHSLKPSHHTAQAKTPAVRPIGKVNQPVAEQTKLEQPKLEQTQQVQAETAQNPQAQQEIASQVPGQDQLQPQQPSDAGNLGSDKLNIGQESQIGRAHV